MSVEGRKEERTATHELSIEELLHINSGNNFTVEGVRDVSFNGIGLNVNTDLKRGEKVRLDFNYRGSTRFQVYGRVAWCSPVTTGLTDDLPCLFMMGVSTR